MAIGAPESAIDPQLCQLQSVGVSLASAIEDGPAPAEDGNFFNYLAIVDDYGRTRDPFS
jgi:hypothetical protein